MSTANPLKSKISNDYTTTVGPQVSIYLCQPVPFPFLIGWNTEKKTKYPKNKMKSTKRRGRTLYPCHFEVFAIGWLHVVGLLFRSRVPGLDTYSKWLYWIFKFPFYSQNLRLGRSVHRFLRFNLALQCSTKQCLDLALVLSLSVCLIEN